MMHAARSFDAAVYQVIAARRLDSVPLINLCFDDIECFMLGAAEFRRYASTLWYRSDERENHGC